MSRRYLIPLALAALAAVSAAPARAGGAEDVGSQIVIPLVAYTNMLTTRVFIHNHDATAVVVQLRYVGEASTNTPGMQICTPGGTSLTLPLGAVVELDLTDPVASGCKLSPPGEQGMFVILAQPAKNGLVVGRISARARIDVTNPSTPSRRQVQYVDGIPLGQLDTTENVHVASGLAWDPAGAVLPGTKLTTDCFAAAFWDGSGAGGMIGSLRLEDYYGGQLGHDVKFALKPFQIVRLADVFSLAGVPPGPFRDVHGEFSFTGFGDEVLAFCRTTLVSPQGRSFGLQVAQVAEPTEESRRREFFADSTPGARKFSIAPTATRELHGIFVRHPDIAVCFVNSTDDLVITAVAPDGTKFTNTSTKTPDFGLLGQSFQGPSDLWGLEITWATTAAKTATVDYQIFCFSGNGTSLADVLADP